MAVISGTTLLVERDDSVVTIRLNRPERMNAMTNTMAAEATAVFEALAVDSTVSVVVLTGTGRGFCPGADLFQIDGDEADSPIALSNFRSASLLHDMPAVTIAAINGPCAGAGLGWAASCDLRYATRSANFSTAFLDRAVAGDMGLPWSLPRLVGAARARQLSLFPDKFSAERAMADGLVTEVFDDDVFRTEVAARVDRLRRASPEALRTLKANYVEAESMPYREFIDLEASRHLNLYGTPAFRARVRSFAADRAPVD